MLPKCLYFIKIHFNAFMLYELYIICLVLACHKFFELNRHFTLTVDFDFYCCTVHVVTIISLIPTHAHLLYTLKITNSH